MFKKGLLTVHIQEYAAVFQYERKNETYIQRQRLPKNRDKRIEVLEDMLLNIIDKANVSKLEHIDTYVMLPHTMAQYDALMEMPNMEVIAKPKQKRVLGLQLENTSTHTLEHPMAMISTQKNNKGKKVGEFFTAGYMDEEEVGEIVKLFFEKGLYLRYVGLEPTTYRHYTNQLGRTLPEDNAAYIHYFYNGEEWVYGFYIFVGSLLAGVRYLDADAYGVRDIQFELEEVLTDCKHRLEGFVVDRYCILSESEVLSEKLQNMYLEKEVVVMEEPYLCNKALQSHHITNPFKRMWKGGVDRP